MTSSRRNQTISPRVKSIIRTLDSILEYFNNHWCEDLSKAIFGPVRGEEVWRHYMKCECLEEFYNQAPMDVIEAILDDCLKAKE